MKESVILHFLKNFPPWIVLGALTVFFVILYNTSGDVAYKEWSSLVLASLFTALGVRATQPQQSANTNSGDVIVSPTESAPLENLTPSDIDGAVEQIREEK